MSVIGHTPPLEQDPVPGAGVAPSLVSREDLASEMESFFLSSYAPLGLLDLDGRVLAGNPALQGLVGRPLPLVLGKPLADFVDDAARTSLVERLALARATEAWPLFLETRLAHTPTTVVAWSLGHAPGSRYLFLSAQDVSQQRAWDHEVAQAQKLEAVGQLASGVAHEINTPIQYVGDNVAFLGDAMATLLKLARQVGALGVEPAPEALQALRAEVEASDLDFLMQEVPRAVEGAREGIGRVATLIRALKQFAHPDPVERSPADLNKALEGTITVSRNEWKYVADLETDLKDVPWVPCHVGALNQVFLNLICNAAHAIQERQTREGHERKGHIRVRTFTEPGWVGVAVVDDGAGIPKSVQGRIFEPFFTTKPAGKGTGQGLSISRSIVVDKHGGRLTFESTEGQGTTFFVWLPTAAPGEAA